MAFHGHLAGESWEVPNLYLLPQDQGKLIKAFNFMGEKFPLVYLAHRHSMTLLENQMQDQEHVVLMDIGIGTAQQEVNILKHLMLTQKLPKKLSIIGIEPSANSLAQAETRLTDFANSNHIEP